MGSPLVHDHIKGFLPINRENQPLVSDELVEFGKQPVEVETSGKLLIVLTRINGIHLKSVKKSERLKHVTGWTWKH